MGFSNVNTVMFSPDMKQTPDNVRKVMDIAGWTVAEAADACQIGRTSLSLAAEGKMQLHPEHWKTLLDAAGHRAFDADEGTL